MTTDYIAEIEAVRSDTEMDPEEKKKALRKLRKLIRKSAGYQRQPRSSSAPGVSRKKDDTLAVSMEQLKENIQEFLAKRKLKQVSAKNEAGYAFTLALSAREGISDPQIFFDKFEQRWGRKPTQFDFITLPKDTLFLLGPVEKGAIQK